MNEFSKLRKKLDDAITYGCFKLAKRLAWDGLRKAQERDSVAEVEYFKGQTEILNGNYYEAIGHFDRTIKYNPQDAAAYNDRALCMVELGIVEEAFDYFDKGIEVEPDYATIYHNKGWLLNKIGRYDEAIACFRKALELEPDRAVTYENLANTLDNLSDYRGALTAYEKAINLLKPEYSDIKKQIMLKIKLIKEKMIHPKD